MIHERTASFRSLLGGLGILALLGSGAAQGVHPHVKVTANQAKAVALKKYSGKIEGKINLENEDGAWQYAVNVRSGKTLREVMVNAMTGKIASVEVTSKAEEAREAKADAAKAKKLHPASHKKGRAAGNKAQ